MRRFAIPKLSAVMMAVTLALPSAAQEDPAGKRRPRGGFFTLAMSGSELEAPRQTSTTDLELFTGLGLSVAGGGRVGRFRFEGELQLHRSERGFTGDSVDFRALMFNAYVDVPVSKRFAFFFGAGIGISSVDVEIDTCLDLEGCPALATVDASASPAAYQYMAGFAWSPSPRRQLFVAYRQLRTEELDLQDSVGNAFSRDYLDMPMALIGITWRFPVSSQGR